MQLTDLEKKVLLSFIEFGIENTGASSVDDLLSDNFTWMSAPDICEATELDKFVVAGLMSSLDKKGLIADSGESARGSKSTDWYATEDGVIVGFAYLNSDPDPEPVYSIGVETKVQVEMSKKWAENNPELFTQRVLRFNEKFPSEEWDRSISDIMPDQIWLVGIRKGDINARKHSV
jgi:hypothetical protein